MATQPIRVTAHRELWPPTGVEQPVERFRANGVGRPSPGFPGRVLRTVIPAGGRAGHLARVAIVSTTGLVWAGRSLQEVLGRPAYWDPTTASDFVAVVAYSAALLLTAASLLILAETARPRRLLGLVILLAAGGCALAGAANGLEDGSGLPGFGSVYVAGALLGGFGMVVTAVMLFAGPARRLAFVPALGAVAMFTFSGGGGLIAIPAWLGFAAFLVRERQGRQQPQGAVL